MIKHVWPALCVAVVLCWVAVAPAQESEPPAGGEAAEAGEASAVVASEQAVGVEDQVDDGRIAERLRDVLVATERFSAIDVQVREGVVFLTGLAAQEESRTLAGDIARRTQGVVAVVNNITLERGPIWTLAPAQRELEDLWRQAIATLPLVVVGLVVLALSFVAARLAQWLISPLVGRSTDSDLLRSVLRKVVYVLVLLVGVYIALRISGLTRVALTVVSGTGIIGLVLGFAFRDIAENFLASLLLSVQRPFRMGDVIEVLGHTGVVRKVTSRGTLLMDFDGNHIQLSNAAVYKSTIRNFTANPRQRLSFTVGIGYEDDIAHAQAVLLAMLREHPAVLEDPEPLVLAESLGASTVNLRAYYWIDNARHSVLKVGSAAIRLGKAALENAGVSMPDEAREVIFPKGVPVVMQGQPDTHTPIAPKAPTPPNTAPNTAPTTPPTTASPAPTPASAESTAGATAGATALATEAEGDLASETRQIEKQADRSRDPEEGANVLGG